MITNALINKYIKQSKVWNDIISTSKYMADNHPIKSIKVNGNNGN